MIPIEFINIPADVQVQLRELVDEWAKRHVDQDFEGVRFEFSIPAPAVDGPTPIGCRQFRGEGWGGSLIDRQLLNDPRLWDTLVSRFDNAYQWQKHGREMMANAQVI